MNRHKKGKNNGIHFFYHQSILSFQDFFNTKLVRSPGPVSSHSPPEGAISLPPGLIYLTPHTCAPTHHFPAGLNHRGLFRHLTPDPLSGKITHTHMCMYVHCFSCSPITFGLCARDTSTTLPSGVSCFWLLFCFCLLAFYLLKQPKLTCIWTQISVFPRAS